MTNTTIYHVTVTDMRDQSYTATFLKRPDNSDFVAAINDAIQMLEVVKFLGSEKRVETLMSLLSIIQLVGVPASPDHESKTEERTAMFAGTVVGHIKVRAESAFNN